MAKKGEPLSWIHQHKNYDGDDCLTWPYAKTGKGHAQVWHEGKQAKAPRIMCELVNGKPPTSGHVAAHSCGKGHLACMSPKHLRWATQEENEQDKVDHGTSNRGTNCAANKLSEDQVYQIRELTGVVTQKSLAAKYGVHRMTVGDIQKRKIWKWLPERTAAHELHDRGS